jgi:hypothetical protein
VITAAVAGREAGRVRLDPRRTSSLRVALTPNGGECSVTFSVAPTAIPADVLAGSADERRLGAHFNGFAYEP